MTDHDRGNYAAALNVFLDLAEKNDAEAQFAIAIMYEFERGLPRDYSEAAKWYGKAAREGLGKAFAGLGMLYEHGNGVPHDLEMAFTMFTLADMHAPSVFHQDAFSPMRERVATQLSSEQLHSAKQKATLWDQECGLVDVPSLPHAGELSQMLDRLKSFL